MSIATMLKPIYKAISTLSRVSNPNKCLQGFRNPLLGGGGFAQHLQDL